MERAVLCAGRGLARSASGFGVASTLCGPSQDTTSILRHTTDLAVRFYELDPYDHVNHAVYLSYFETARIEALESVGVGLAELEDRGFHIVVTDVDVHFSTPAVAGDRLTIETAVVEMQRATHHWRQDIIRADTPIVEMKLRAAMTDVAGRPTRIPDFFRAALSNG